MNAVDISQMLMVCKEENPVFIVLLSFYSFYVIRIKPLQIIVLKYMVSQNILRTYEGE